MFTDCFPRAARGENQTGNQMSASDEEYVGGVGAKWEDNGKAIGGKEESGMY